MQSIATKPIRIVVPFAAGGTALADLWRCLALLDSQLHPTRPLGAADALSGRAQAPAWHGTYWHGSKQGNSQEPG